MTEHKKSIPALLNSYVGMKVNGLHQRRQDFCQVERETLVAWLQVVRPELTSDYIRQQVRLWFGMLPNTFIFGRRGVYLITAVPVVELVSRLAKQGLTADQIAATFGVELRPVNIRQISELMRGGHASSQKEQEQA